MADTYLTKTFGTPTNNKIWTCSAWLKRANSTNNHSHLSTGTDTSNRGVFYFNTGTSADFQYYEASGGSAQLWIQTNQQFRDCNGWYHIVVSVDTTQATASNRWKLYVNGEQVTSFATATYPSQNYDTFINKASARHDISGRNNHSNADFYWEGAISHYHFIDGTAYDASAFGQYDANGVWTIKTSPSVTYGTNGFFILKDGNSVTDQSGNSNNWTVAGGTLTNTEDNPSNVFATLNPLIYTSNTDKSFANGNTYIDLGGTARVPEYSTLGMTSGKWYAEVKDISGSGGNSIAGISGQTYRANVTDYLGTSAYDYSYLSSNGTKINNGTDSAYGNTWTDGDIIGIAVDLDNLKIYFSKNGVWQNSGDPTSGATGTGAAFTLTAPSSTSEGAYFFSCSDDNQFAARRMAWNFGNGYFQTTAVSSAGTNASGIGIFEHDVPNGYTSLSTKGLNL